MSVHKIKEVAKAQRTLPDGKPIFEVWLESDEKKYTCFNPEILEKKGQEIDVQITEKKNGNFTNYILTLKNGNGNGKSFAKSNSDKQVALSQAVLYLKDKQGVTKENVTSMADYFLAWLKKK